jgi:hypothetical protein
MTKSEFLHKTPYTIDHKTWGYGVLEIIVNNTNRKGICYRHEDQTSSYGTYGTSWQNLYDDLHIFLKQNNHL